MLNPSEGRRTYVDGVENSAVKVRDCSRPSLEVESSSAARPSSGAGTFEATLSYVAPANGLGATPSGFTAELRRGSTTTPLSASEFTVAPDGSVSVDLAGLDDGKYHLYVTPHACLLYTSPSPRDRTRSRMPSSA